MTESLDPYDAILLVSFGGPEGPDEVLPFLRRVTAGRGIPDDRLVEVGRHYELFGGRSPINDQCRALIGALEDELVSRGLAMPVLWGNRNSEPFLADTLRTAARDGHRRVLALTTSAFASYSSCRQYRENLADAMAEVPSGLVVDRLGQYALRPAYAATVADLLLDDLATLPPRDGERLPVLFVTHSIPTSMDVASGPPAEGGGAYVRDHEAVMADVLARVRAVGRDDVAGELVMCSRSGPPHQPWLEPDVGDRIAQLGAAGHDRVVLVPIGFTSDHMEVIYDLDTEAAESAREHGVTMVRTPTVGVHHEFVADLVDGLVERAGLTRNLEAGGDVDLTSPSPQGSRAAECPAGCCANARGARPALCGRD